MSEIPPQPPVDPTPASPMPAPGMGDPADVEKNKVFALLSYLGILVLVPILAAKDSPFAKYHANQGLLLLLVGIVVGVVMGCGGFAFPFVPVIGKMAWCLTCILYPVIWVGFLAYAIIGILNAVNGKMKPLPGFPAITLIK